MGQIIAVVRSQPIYLAPKAIYLFLVQKLALIVLLFVTVFPSIVDMGSFLDFYQKSLTERALSNTSLVTKRSIYQKNLFEESFSIRHRYYDFENVRRAFAHRTALHYLSQFDRRAVINNVAKTLPKKERMRAYRYLPYFFYFGQKYKVDPYWAIAIAWTESHFNTRARSWVGAKGLMQLMPQTQKWLQTQIRKKSKYGNRSVRNIELGIYYLAKLLKQFDGNFREATVAYNMGPGWVKRWKAKKRYVGSRRNVYLNKVKKYYNTLSTAHYKFVRGCDYEYKQTYVVRPSRARLKNYGLSLERELRMAMAPLLTVN